MSGGHFSACTGEVYYNFIKRTEEEYVKDIQLEWDDYYTWLERAQRAKQLWLNEEITDDEFLIIVHELD